MKHSGLLLVILLVVAIIIAILFTTRLGDGTSSVENDTQSENHVQQAQEVVDALNEKINAASN